ncbi:MAG: non-homologous end-joining DNA ligase [Gammaproteobacteria bacterium]|jgi:bifunctional non-homologous end joining protein LigD
MSVERFGPYSVELSNTDKVLFPDSGTTKGDLIRYYREVAGVMIPHLRNRPLTLHRFPDGIDHEGFYQQESPDYLPEWIETRRVQRAGNGAGDPVEHVLCNKQATLVYLANQAVITLHAWLARAPAVTRPDRLIFDLDPKNHAFSDVRKAAHRVVALMRQLGMSPFAMTTGSRGLHIVAPLRAERDFDAVRALARDMAACLAERHPEALTVEQRKDKREGRIYLDVMRNAYGQTAVVPYSVRPLPGAPVATPLDLAELEDSDLDPQRWRLGNILRRLGQKPDPWADIQGHATTADRATEALRKLSE